MQTALSDFIGKYSAGLCRENFPSTQISACIFNDCVHKGFHLLFINVLHSNIYFAKNYEFYIVLSMATRFVWHKESTHVAGLISSILVSLPFFIQALEIAVIGPGRQEGRNVCMGLFEGLYLRDSLLDFFVWNIFPMWIVVICYSGNRNCAEVGPFRLISDCAHDT